MMSLWADNERSKKARRVANLVLRRERAVNRLMQHQRTDADYDRMTRWLLRLARLHRKLLDVAFGLR
jgi:hypothetical protein